MKNSNDDIQMDVYKRIVALYNVPIIANGAILEWGNNYELLRDGKPIDIASRLYDNPKIWEMMSKINALEEHYRTADQKVSWLDIDMTICCGIIHEKIITVGRRKHIFWNDVTDLLKI